MKKYWIAVASKEHVQHGKAEGIMQICHGKAAGLRRIKPHDWIIYYSPKEIFNQNKLCRMFTALGQVNDKEPYQYKMSDDFIPWRRDVKYIKALDIAIELLIDKLTFIKNKKNWGFIFRFGLLEIPKHDFQTIALAMGIEIE